MTIVDLARYQLVIDGRRVEAASGQRYDSVDPYLGAREFIGKLREMGNVIIISDTFH